MNIIDKYISDKILNLLNTVEISLTQKEIQENIDCQMDEVEMSFLLFHLTQIGILKQNMVVRPGGFYTAWTVYKNNL